jgi:hypothetical protein
MRMERNVIARNGDEMQMQVVFEILVRGLIGLEAGEEMQQLKQQFQEFIVGLMSLPIKLPGTRLYRSLQVLSLSLSPSHLSSLSLSTCSTPCKPALHHTLISTTLFCQPLCLSFMSDVAQPYSMQHQQQHDQCLSCHHH